MQSVNSIKKETPQQPQSKITLKLLAVALISCATSLLLANTINNNFGIIASDIGLIGFSVTFVIFSFALLKKYDIKTTQGKLVLLFALFAVFRSMGEITWIVLEQVIGIDPFPSIADFFWLFGNLLFIGFLTFHFIQTKTKTKTKTKTNLYAAIIPVVYVVISLSTSPIDDYTTTELIVGMLYPVTDAIMVGLIFTLLVSHPKNNFLIFTLAGIMCMTISDMLYMSALAEYVTGNPMDFGWILGYVFLLFSTRYYTSIKKNTVSESSGLYLLSDKLETMLKVTVPFVTITIILSFALLYYHIKAVTENPEVEPYIMTAVFSSFAVMVFFLSKNLMKFVQIRTQDLQDQKEFLENELKEQSLKLVKQEKLVAIGQLAARLGHDIRNPLLVIQGSLYLVKRGLGTELDQKTQSHFTRIDDAILRISYQLENVLDFVRVKPLLLSKCNIQEMIWSVCKKISIPAEIQLNLPQNDAIVNCDAKRLEIVFINLITNAIQAIQNTGKITLQILEKNNSVHILVQDSGPGIPAEIQNKLFEPLVTTKQRGTGLGLVSCKTIVEQHGGKITVTNNPTTFTITLPKVK